MVVTIRGSYGAVLQGSEIKESAELSENTTEGGFQTLEFEVKSTDDWFTAVTEESFAEDWDSAVDAIYDDV